MQVQSIVCTRCGGPLPAVQPPAIIECGFCGVGLSISAGLPTISREPSNTPPATDHAGQRRAFVEKLRERLDANVPAEQALCEASAAHLGAAGQTDTLARVVLAFARDFETESKISIERDAMALARVAETYLMKVVELREASETEMNLPFLAANETGPKHYQRRITAALIQQLASGARLHIEEVAPASTASTQSAASSPAPEPTKKKWWWPF